MNKHTPGPWQTSRDAVPAGHVQVTVYEEATGQRVATAFEREENARLIAAAPDLLAALVECEQFVGDRGDDKDDEEDHLLGTIRAAIAKARGQA